MADEPRLVRAPGVIWRRTMRGVLISTDDQREPLLCTSPGDVVWMLLAEPATRGELCDQLGELYGTEPDTIAADLADVLDTLVAAGALVPLED